MRAGPRPLLAIGLVVTLAAATACSDDDADPGPGDEVDASAQLDLGEKPEVTLDDAVEADELVVEDLVVGEGAEAAEGSAVQVHYVGVSAASGEQFEASWDRGEPFTFQLGAGGVIEGWERGVEGMQVGGRRQLTIPPELAYGERGVPGAIAPGETLVFVVDLLEVS